MFGQVFERAIAPGAILLSAAFAMSMGFLVGTTPAAAQAQNVVVVPQVTPSFIPSAQDIQGAKGGAEIFGALTLSTDNRSQGFTSSNEETAVQGDIGVIFSNFYAGISASNVDFGQIVLPNGNLAGLADLELTYYAGYVNVYKKIDYDVGVSYATFPGARDAPGQELNYWEWTAGIGREFGENWRGGPARVGFRVNYSHDYSGDSGDNIIYEGTLKKALGKYGREGKILPSLTANVGYQDGDVNRGNIDYWFWSAGIDIKVRDRWNIDLRYHDAAEVPFNCDNLCDSAFVAMLSYEFSINLGQKKEKPYK